MTAMAGIRQLAAADARPAALPEGLVARVRGAAATQLARRLGPARLFSPSEDDRALVWAVISERLAEAHREHVLAGNTPLDQQEQEGVARAVFDALLGLGPSKPIWLARMWRSCWSTAGNGRLWSAPAAPKTALRLGFRRRRSCGRSPPAPSRSPAAGWMRPTPRPTPGCQTAAACT